MKTIMRQSVIVASLLCGLSTPALALDSRQAEAVVGILEQLAHERGEAVYMDAAYDWFEFDAEGQGIITAAGFDEQSWVSAYEETLMGYGAGIGEAEIDAQIAQAEAGVAASSLSSEQKSAILADFYVQMDAVRAAAREGQAYAAAVAPVRERLRVLVEGE